MIEFLGFTVVMLLLLLWVSAFIRFLGVLLSAKDREAFKERPFLHVLWFGAAAVTAYFTLFFPGNICRPPREYGEIVQAKGDLKNLEHACRAYANEYGPYPKGNNAEIVQILTSNNTRRIVFLEIPSRRHAISKQGEFVDPWGTPYKFSIIEGNLPVIFSAGPNHLFGDQDDLSTTN